MNATAASKFDIAASMFFNFYARPMNSQFTLGEALFGKYDALHLTPLERMMERSMFMDGVYQAFNILAQGGMEVLPLAIGRLAVAKAGGLVAAGLTRMATRI